MSLVLIATVLLGLVILLNNPLAQVLLVLLALVGVVAVLKRVPGGDA